MAFSWPPDKGDLPVAYAEVLGWPLFAGGRHVLPDRLRQLFASGSDVALTTTCSEFDAVDLPFRAGMAAQVQYEKHGLVVPCLVERRCSVTILISAGTGKYISHVPGIRVRSGPEERQVLPPAPGVRWDTTPWSCTKRRPVRLPDGRALSTELSGIIRLYGSG